MREVLIEPAELIDRLAGGGPTPVLADVRWTLNGPPGRPEFEQGHLPGAVWVDLETELSAPPGDGGRHPLPDPAVFAAAVRRTGIDADREVVVYDGASSLAASRLWWLLTDGGHRAVRVLNGGFAAWQAAGGPVEAGPGRVPAPGGFVPGPGHREQVDAATIAAAGRAIDLVDVRAPERFRGEVEPIDAVAGHIPGAVNRPAAANLDPTGRFLPSGPLAAAYAGLDHPVLYCGSGITATQALLALEAAGRTDGRIYPGSWSDWISDPHRPVATG